MLQRAGTRMSEEKAQRTNFGSKGSRVMVRLVNNASIARQCRQGGVDQKGWRRRSKTKIHMLQHIQMRGQRFREDAVGYMEKQRCCQPLAVTRRRTAVVEHEVILSSEAVSALPAVVVDPRLTDPQRS